MDELNNIMPVANIICAVILLALFICYMVVGYDQNRDEKQCKSSDKLQNTPIGYDPTYYLIFGIFMLLGSMMLAWAATFQHGDWPYFICLATSGILWAVYFLYSMIAVAKDKVKQQVVCSEVAEKYKSNVYTAMRFLPIIILSIMLLASLAGFVLLLK